MAVFESYEDSLKSFITNKGDIIRGKSDPEAFMRSLQEFGGFGIDMDTGKKVPGYVHNTANTIKGLRPVIAQTKAKAGK